MQRLMHRACCILCVFVLLASFAPAEAQIAIQHGTANALAYCQGSKLYSANSTDAPPVIAGSFAGDGKRTVFRTCRDADGNIHYFIRKPRPNRNGVCRTYESEIFPGSETDFIIVDTLYDGMAPHWFFDMKGWTGIPPASWTALRYGPRSSILGFVAGGDCPLGDDARYIPLKNVTDGLLASFQSYWDKIARSPEALRSAFANVPTSSGPGIAVDQVPNQRLRDSLMAAIFKKHDHFHFISCDADGCTAWLEGQSIGFDAGANGIVLTRLSAIWVS